MAFSTGNIEQRKGIVVANLSIIALVCYQAVLCFVHTNISSVTNTGVAVTEASVLIIAAISVARAAGINYCAYLIYIVAYFSGLWMFRGGMAPEELRNILIIIIFFNIGVIVSSREAADKLLTTVSLIVVIFGVLEYFFMDYYLKYFNIFDYYVSRGVLDGHVPEYLKSNLYLSGIRPAGRNIFSFLGGQRVSSIFLEPVSLGNYAVILAMWGLSYDFSEWRKGLKHIVLAIIFAIGCDSRFASAIIIFVIIGRLVPVIQSKMAVFSLPFLAVLIMMLYVVYGSGRAGQDDFAGRVMLSAMAVYDMRMANVFGVGIPEPLSDMGIAYSIENFGLFMCLVLWFIFSFMEIESKYGRRLRAMAAIYIIGILVVSGTAFFSAKTAAILWFMFGASLGYSRRYQNFIRERLKMGMTSLGPLIGTGDCRATRE